jgi:RNA polymerase sigma-70 factor (ECF subfamily)
VSLEDEKELIHKSKSDPEAFSLLYEKYYDLLLNYVVRRTGNVELAKDIVSETFYKAFKKRWLFQWKGIPFSAWLYRIANNEVKQYYRKSRYQMESFERLLERSDMEPVSDYSLEEEVLRAQDELEKHQQFLFFQQKISELPVKYQEVLALRYFAEKSLKEISQIVGKPEGTIKSLLHRGIEQLKKFVK